MTVCRPAAQDVVVYPHMVIPLFVGREKSILALDLAMKSDKRILLVAQKQADVTTQGGRSVSRGTIATSCSSSSSRCTVKCSSRARSVRTSTS